MKAKLHVLASGSSGNALYFGVGGTRLLIDAGISMRAIRNSLAGIGEDPSALSAVLVTHEHSDHVRALPQIRRQLPHVPVYSTRGTARSLERRGGPLVNRPLLSDAAVIEFDHVQITPFDVSHDAAEPIGLRIDCGDFALGIATDLGIETPRVVEGLSGCRVIVLEANHDEDMLRRGPYPQFLKRRIASPAGHLSNRQAAELLTAVASPGLETVLLAHMSRHNNTTDRAVEQVGAALEPHEHVSLEQAHMHPEHSPIVFEVSSVAAKRPRESQPPTQLDLFD